tara:strand:+ start:174 stop:314 length:141 start_codon:yes stop_codon:yes gene_type:complete
MSWTDYTNFLIENGSIQKGFVLGISDGLIWAASNGETTLGNYEMKS